MLPSNLEPEESRLHSGRFRDLPSPLSWKGEEGRVQGSATRKQLEGEQSLRADDVGREVGVQGVLDQIEGC